MWHFGRARGPQVSHTEFSDMGELAFRHTNYQISVSLMKWQIVVNFLLSTAVDIFAWHQQQKIQFRRNVFP
jgi:hypothetical protein